MSGLTPDVTAAISPAPIADASPFAEDIRWTASEVGADRAPKLALRAAAHISRSRSVRTPRVSSLSTTSRMAKAVPSSTARARCAGP